MLVIWVLSMLVIGIPIAVVALINGIEIVEGERLDAPRGGLDKAAVWLVIIAAGLVALVVIVSLAAGIVRFLS